MPHYSVHAPKMLRLRRRKSAVLRKLATRKASTESINGIKSPNPFDDSKSPSLSTDLPQPQYPPPPTRPPPPPPVPSSPSPSSTQPPPRSAFFDLTVYIRTIAVKVAKHTPRKTRQSNEDIEREIEHCLSLLKARREIQQYWFSDWSGVQLAAEPSRLHLPGCAREHCVCRSVAAKGYFARWPCAVPCSRSPLIYPQLREPQAKHDSLVRSRSVARDRLDAYKEYHQEVDRDERFPRHRVGVSDPTVLFSLGYRDYIKRMSSSSGTPESWISSFCSLLGHEYFAEISEDFIEDDFNLTGLQSQVAMYKEALEVNSNPGVGHSYC